VIMYLPPPDGGGGADARRTAIEAAFARYVGAWDAGLWDRHSCQEHWAKSDPRAPDRPARARARIRARFPVAEFNAARARLDPRGVLANDAVRRLLDD
jgi:hypothetical protein